MNQPDAMRQCMGIRTVVSDLERVVKRLDDVGEVRTEREFSDDVRHVNFCSKSV